MTETIRHLLAERPDTALAQRCCRNEMTRKQKKNMTMEIFYYVPRNTVRNRRSEAAPIEVISRLIATLAGSRNRGGKHRNHRALSVPALPGKARKTASNKALHQLFIDGKTPPCRAEPKVPKPGRYRKIAEGQRPGMPP
ncbi:hypothetical protein PUP68_02500 [Pseudomonas chlororaphis]|uniref:hypothetical protein n=1 Tax=Pseudomonas chlororaphis TaxID=587753 RepID=UPI002368BA48|nr:hypothetical protein [Pseudomonas chlororaphis]WDG80960.1 hypothetical protein PUP77_09740 [Pseudomonas chlororaphis]WDG85987.1 hypothetical protein PUP68_02500 [Pseudomonas chlororaphis]